MAESRQFCLLVIYSNTLLVNFITNVAGCFEIDYERNTSQCLFINTMISTENAPSDLTMYFTTTQQTRVPYLE